jgi:putative heme-binding domain-containing protein
MTKLQTTVSCAAALCILFGGPAAGRLAAEGVPARRAIALAQAGQDTPSGDAARGKALVESSGCFDCHRIDDRGSRLGPNLSSIGRLRTPVRLRQALIAPDEEVVADNRFVRLVTKDGTTVTGRLLNQDAISVQLINPKEELRTYLRANLRELTILDKGLMPSVQGKLTDQQVADIVTYLLSLKGT